MKEGEGMSNLKDIWIPIEILTDNKLSDKEKVIYAIVIYLSNENNVMDNTGKKDRCNILLGHTWKYSEVIILESRIEIVENRVGACIARPFFEDNAKIKSQLNKNIKFKMYKALRETFT